MYATLVIVPPDGGEQDYVIEMEFEHAPVAGDYIQVYEQEEGIGVRAFLVRSVHHHSKITGQENVSSVFKIAIEVELVRYAFNSKYQKDQIEYFERKGHEVKDYPETMY